MKRPVETSGFASSASVFSWRKSAWSVFVFVCASCTLRITSSSESASAACAAEAGSASAAAQSASAKNFLTIGLQHGLPQRLRPKVVFPR